MNEMLMLLNKQITLNKFMICNYESSKDELLRIEKDERDLYEYEKKDLKFYYKAINDLSNEINIYSSIYKILMKSVD